MLNEYIKWSNKEEQIEHIGVLTKETDTHVFLLTKYGEMCIPVTDGEFCESSREQFELVVVEEKEVVVKHEVTVRSGTKAEKALDIYKQLWAEGKARKDIIKEFKNQLDMSDACASTYYQNTKKATGN